jgi:hypothetical protein
MASHLPPDYLDLQSLDLLALPEYHDYTPRSMDSFDRLLDNCSFSFCPLLQAKLCKRSDTRILPESGAS